MKTRFFVWAASYVLALAMAGCTASDDAGAQGPGGSVGTPGTPGGMTTTPAGGTTTPPTGTDPGTTGGTTTPPTPGTDPSTAGTGGTTPPVGTEPPPIGTPVDEDFPDPRGACPGVMTAYPGDDVCILPPAAGEGIQIHVGPTSYTDMAEVNRFVFPVGQENSQCWSFHTPNTEEVYYQSFVLSARPGTHHIINSMYMTDGPDGTSFTACRDPGTGTNPDSIGNLPGASKAYMPRGRVAPENAAFGRKIPARNFAQADMHFFNFTQGPLLREFWMNIYTVPKEQITMEANQIRAMGGLSWSVIPIPVETRTVYHYSCPINAAGRIVALLGHYHAHGKRFTAWVTSGGVQKKVFEMYDYLDPAIFSYDSITTNPEFSTSGAGATSGMLDVKAGDLMEWECDIDNTSANTAAPPAPLRYLNEVKTGEMCNLWGESIGPLINCTVF